MATAADPKKATKAKREATSKKYEIKNPIKAIRIPVPAIPKGPPTKDTKLLIVGSGASSTAPHFFCTAVHDTVFKPLPDGSLYECTACTGTDKYASHNRRANTSMIISKEGKDEEGKGIGMKTFIFDLGKVWKQNAMLLFRAHGLGKVDGVLLSHHHDDAMQIGWCRDFYENIVGQKFLDGYGDKDELKIQDKLNIYSTELAKQNIPSFLTKSKDYRWQIVEDTKPQTIEGTQITPFDVQHGKQGRDAVWFTSFLVGTDVLYMSDVSSIPDDKAHKLTGLKPKVLVIDCIDTRYFDPHPAHFNILPALEWAKKIDPERTYLTGMAHNTAHQTYLWLLDPNDSDDPENANADYREDNSDFNSATYRQHLAELRKKVKGLMRKSDGTYMDVRPAYDGLCIVIPEDGGVYDDDD